MEYSNLIKSAKTAILTKRSARDSGYFDDDFIDFFSTESKSPSIINLFVYFRVHSISLVLRKFFDSFRSQKVQLVILGGGLDTVPFVFLEKYDNLVCFENDFEIVMRSKASIMMNSPKFLKLLPDLKESSGIVTTERYRMVPFDLTDCSKFSMFFESGLSSQLPTLVLSDYSLTYLESKYSNKILKSFADFFECPSLYVFFEKSPTLNTHPPSSVTSKSHLYFEKTTGWFCQSQRDYPSLESLVERFMYLGWDGVHFKPISYFFNILCDSERERLMGLNEDSWNFISRFSHFHGLGVAYKNFQNTEFFNFLVLKPVNLLKPPSSDPEMSGESSDLFQRIVSITDHFIALSNLDINEHINF